MIVALDVAGRVVVINRKGCEILGYEEKDIIGKDWFVNFVPERVRQQVREVFREVITGERESVEHFENSVLTKQGEERIVEWHNTELRDEDGRISGTLSSGADVTARKRAEEALREREARMATILETAVDGIITIDERGTIESANQAVERLFGYRADELVGRNVKVLMPSPYREEHDGYLASYMRTGEKKIIGIGREVEGKRKDGSVFPLDIAISEVSFGNGVSLPDWSGCQRAQESGRVDPQQ